MVKTSTSESAAKAAKPRGVGGLRSTQSSPVKPGAKGAKPSGAPKRPRLRNKKGQYMSFSPEASSARPLPGSAALQSALADSSLFDEPVVSADGTAVTLPPKSLGFGFTIRALPAPHIHNKYYAVWMIGTICGMAATAWIVHHFNL